eukprot:3780488-Alexandrium_andersonii.AAC.1
MGSGNSRAAAGEARAAEAHAGHGLHESHEAADAQELPAADAPVSAHVRVAGRSHAFGMCP